MRVKKTKEDETKLSKFMVMMNNIFTTYAWENPQKDTQTIFDNIKEALYDNAGSLYLCFTCGNVLDRKELSVQNYFQINRVWHPCQGGDNNMTFPTAGIVTRWEKAISYIESTGVEV